MPTTYVRDGGQFREIRNIYVRDGGVWRQLTNAYVRDGGQWREVYRRAFTETYEINGNTNTSFILRDELIGDGWNTTDPVEITIEVNARQGQSNSLGAIVVSGSYPADSTLRIVVSGSGSVRGAGGDGANGRSGPGGTFPGETGGTAIYIRNIDTTIVNNGTIAAGGTGGDGGSGGGSDPFDHGGGGGGGGAGSPPGEGGNGGSGNPPSNSGDPGQDGTITAGGNGGDGGPQGQDGFNGFDPGEGPTVARTGSAIDGNTNVSSFTGNAVLGELRN